MHDCLLLFSLQSPIKQLSASRSTAILKELTANTDLDPAVFTAKTFHKSGVRVESMLGWNQMPSSTWQDGAKLPKVSGVTPG